MGFPTAAPLHPQGVCASKPAQLPLRDGPKRGRPMRLILLKNLRSFFQCLGGAGSLQADQPQV
jgi:hypothetical protein